MGREKRKAARAANQAVQTRKQEFLAGKGTPNANMPGSSAGGILAGPLQTTPVLATDTGAGGWAVSDPGAKPATGNWPAVNPWLIPKSSGLNITSQTYPSNYYVEWDLSTWRVACDRVMKQGFTPDYATMVAWCFEASPFIQSMFRTIETAMFSVPMYYCDEKGNVIDEWTQELCNKRWQMEMKREMAFSFFWGFSGLNFDPISEKLYKYPIQDLDPLNRFLRQSTYSFYDGVFFNDHDNLLWCQPNTSYESFLGWMQPIAREFIRMNMNDNNWLAAGKKLAFPVFTIGYPEGNDSADASGKLYNPYRDEAETIARDIGPGKAVVYPYVKLPNGEIQKNVDIEFEKTGASQKAHSIFQDFNEVKKNEIRELILGGTLTADAGDKGSRALGEVQERKLQKFLMSVIEYVIAEHNSDYKRKLSKFYKGGLPKGRFDINRAKQWTMEEIVAWAGVLSQSGQRFTTDFFEANGIPQNFIEDNPIAMPQNAKPGLTKNNDGRVQDLSTRIARIPW